MKAIYFHYKTDHLKLTRDELVDLQNLSDERNLFAFEQKDFKTGRVIKKIRFASDLRRFFKNKRDYIRFLLESLKIEFFEVYTSSSIRVIAINKKTVD